MRRFGGQSGREEMRKGMVSLLLAGLLLVAALTGCGGGGERLNLNSPADNVNLSLRLPAGWALEGRVQNGMAFFSEKENPENRGTVTIWRAEGKDLGAFVDDVLAQSEKMQQSGEILGGAMEHLAGPQAGELPQQALGWELVSRTPKQVGEWEAVEVVENMGGKKCITLWVKKGDRVCQAAFFSLPEAWDKNEPLFRASLETVKIR